MAFVENFSHLRRESMRIFPKNPKAIVTASGYAYNEGFKFWAAEQVESGARLVVAQHGGHYGVGKWSATEEHEVEISDRFLTWGWVQESSRKVRPVGAAQLRRFAESKRVRRDGDILWVLMAIPRWAYFLYSVPIGPQFRHYMDEQIRFAHHSSAPVRQLLQVRLHPYDYGWQEDVFFQRMCPGIRAERGSGSFHRQLRECRLVVATYNATTYLESFVANIPTIVFWDPQHWEIRGEAAELFEALELAGVLHYSPESAAELLNEIYCDPHSWWQQSKIQHVRRAVCEQFAHYHPTWIKDWTSELRSISGK
jgi:putative transferase (TIGR04331 family)